MNDPRVSASDAAVVLAVRNGDAERYRELVERYERRVFAVAWSRLGDASMAEEAAQETFIRGYRRLWLLSDGAKFAGWIASIARRVAINLGLRHRRELNKRARWSLERHESQSLGGEGAVGATEAYSPEVIRQTLASLPPMHRECLVLFYIQGKSGAAAAAALGISESAFRVRLHRARAVLRDQLVVQLEHSLERLRPTTNLPAAIMSIILLPGSAHAAMVGGGLTGVGSSLGTKGAAVVGKSFLSSWLTSLLWMVSLIPSLLWTAWLSRMERLNFCQPGGFRGRLHQGLSRSFLWGFPILMLGVLLLTQGSMRRWGIQGHSAILAGFLTVLLVVSARALIVNRHPFQVGLMIYSGILLLGFALMALDWLPAGLGFVPVMVATLVMIGLLRYRPSRMDYSLFLRASQGLIPATVLASPALSPRPMDRATLLAFARFLGERWLVHNFCWDRRGLNLRLTPVQPTFGGQFLRLFQTVPRNASFLALGLDGSVQAQCGVEDARALAVLNCGSKRVSDLEDLVVRSVAWAQQRYLVGDHAQAETSLGQVAEAEIFVVPPERARSTRWWRLSLGCGGAIMALGLAMTVGRARFGSPLPAVQVTASEIRAALAAPARATNGIGAVEGDLLWALSSIEVLPSIDWMTPEAVARVREVIFRVVGWHPLDAGVGRFEDLNRSWLLQRALVCDWLTWKDLGVDPVWILNAWRTEARDPGDSILARRRIHLGRVECEVERIHFFGLNQLRWLNQLGGLAGLNRGALVAKILASQEGTGGEGSAAGLGRPRRSLRGLFVNPGWPVLPDTYLSVAALELLGGLDQLDRAACVERLLALHRGAGYFASAWTDSVPEAELRGDARDTFCAFETLRILGALDRVKDLERWKFRPMRRSGTLEKGVVRAVTWEEIEAWLCQQSLEGQVRELRREPERRWRSLRSVF